MNRSTALIILLLSVLIAPEVRAQEFDVKTHTLKNGMKILVQEDHSIPNVALYIFYRIGSRNERPGTTGLSHYFEHMMFNGAKKYGSGEFDRVMEANGGSNNAYTTQNVTVYQDSFPNSALELIFDLEADRIANLSFDPKIVESERGVVANERRVSVDNNNTGVLNEQLWATAFVAHPYQWPVIGWMSDIESWKTEYLQNHFRMGYSPSNATMVVAGAVKLEEVLKLAQRYLETIPSRTPPAPVTTQEPEQQGERRVVVRKFAQLPVLMIGYHVPRTNSPEFYPLQVLETVLLSGQSSRLYQRLVDKEQVALSVSGGWDWAFDPTLFEFSVQPKAGADVLKVEQLFNNELERLQRGGITDQELEKSKNIRIAEFYRQMKTIDGKANTIGAYEVFFGDYRKLFSAAEGYAKVTRDEVQRVAQRYFTEKNRTTATLVPEPVPEVKSDTGAGR
jgi:zinc protease